MANVVKAIGKGVGLLLVGSFKLLWLIAKGIFGGAKKLNAHNERVAAKKHRDNQRELTRYRLDRERKNWMQD